MSIVVICWSIKKKEPVEKVEKCVQFEVDDDSGLVPSGTNRLEECLAFIKNLVQRVKGKKKQRGCRRA